MALKQFYKQFMRRLGSELLYITHRPIHSKAEPAALHDANVAMIDMDKYDSDFNELSQSVIHGLETYGFLSLRNVAGLDTKAIHSLSRTFFDKDIDYKLKYAKHKWNPSNPNRYRGYKYPANSMFLIFCEEH